MQTGLLVPVELDDLSVQHFTIVKSDPLTEGEFEGVVIEPAPGSGQTRHEITLRIDLKKMLKDIEGQGDLVRWTFIDNAQFPAWRWNWFSPTHVPPPEDDEYENETTKSQLSHGNSSLTALFDHDGPLPRGGRYERHVCGRSPVSSMDSVIQNHRLSLSNIHHRGRQILTKF